MGLGCPARGNVTAGASPGKTGLGEEDLRRLRGEAPGRELAVVMALQSLGLSGVSVSPHEDRGVLGQQHKACPACAAP